jgi:hypothetical protein
VHFLKEACTQRNVVILDKDLVALLGDFPLLNANWTAIRKRAIGDSHNAASGALLLRAKGEFAGYLAILHVPREVCV